MEKPAMSAKAEEGVGWTGCAQTATQYQTISRISISTGHTTAHSVADQMTADEPINANPQVKDVSQLPTRQAKGGDSGKTEHYPHEVYRTRLSKLVSRYSFHSRSLKGSCDDVDDASDEEEEEDKDDGDSEPLDAQEVYDLISSISDPEHPLTLGQLSVVNLGDIRVRHPDYASGRVGEVNVQITPTITHCSLATLIGLGIRVRLDRSVDKAYRIGIYVKQGTHQSEGQVNKQLNDKERVCAACENPQLVKVVGRMLATCTVQN